MIIQKFIRCPGTALRMRMAQEDSFDSQEVLGFRGCRGFLPSGASGESQSSNTIFTEEIAISP
jgi:hypothetical protein